MSAKKQDHEAEFVHEEGKPVKTVSLQVAVTDPHLQNTILAAFDLAKSAGRELDLVFDVGACGIPFAPQLSTPGEMMAGQ